MLNNKVVKTIQHKYKQKMNTILEVSPFYKVFKEFPSILTTSCFLK